jgi:NAD-dependent deacetylase
MSGGKKHVVVLTGAGISAESGLKTFRDGDGLWEGHRVEDVATPRAWEKDPALVLEFYNQRRRAMLEAEPNAAHRALLRLEGKFEVTIVTQNVDDLHERAGSSRVVHLHGELRKARSTADSNFVYEISGPDLNLGDLCEKGSQLRPHIVWFGEMVPMMGQAVALAQSADIFVVVGTSLVVYPAASLIEFVPGESIKYVIDPVKPTLLGLPNLKFIGAKAGVGVPRLVEDLLRSDGAPSQ